MTQIIIDHGVSGCFGTRLAPGLNSPPSILIRLHAAAHTPGMEGNGLTAVEHLAGVAVHEPCDAQSAWDRRRIPTEIVQRSTKCRGCRYQ